MVVILFVNVGLNLKLSLSGIARVLNIVAAELMAVAVSVVVVDVFNLSITAARTSDLTVSQVLSPRKLT